VSFVVKNTLPLASVFAKATPDKSADKKLKSNPPTADKNDKAKIK
jgi:hypothetical protein